MSIRYPQARRGGRWHKPLRRILLTLLLAVLAVTVLPVVVLRFVPPPTTAFMLQSPTRPVQHRWVSHQRIAEHARRAVVAAEDQKFWTHRGFDLDAIEKAHAHNQRSARKRGASTISQQTAKNLFLWSGGGYFRKGLEAGYTALIEFIWPKQRILEVYLNVAEFGPGIYGVEAASRHYFRRSAAELSAQQAALLAAVLPSPRRWRAQPPGPYVQQRAQWILGQMGERPRSAQAPVEPAPEAPVLPAASAPEPAPESFEQDRFEHVPSPASDAAEAPSDTQTSHED